MYDPDKYYDEILQQILNSDYVKQRIEELREDDPDRSEYEIVSEALDDFFNDDYDVIFSVDSVFEYVIDWTKDTISQILSTKTEFIENIDFSLEDYVMKILDVLHTHLDHLLRKKYGVKL
jgi:hypothetical protein